VDVDWHRCHICESIELAVVHANQGQPELSLADAYYASSGTKPVTSI